MTEIQCYFAGEVERVEIGDVIVQGGDAHLQYHNENDSTVWPG